MSSTIQQSFLNTLGLYSDQSQRSQLSLFYLDPMIQDFVKGLYIAEKRTFDFGWSDVLTEHFGEENIKLLRSFTFRKIGKHYVLALKNTCGDVFAFQRALQGLLSKKGVLSFRQFAKEQLRSLMPHLEELKVLSSKSPQLKEELSLELERVSAELKEVSGLLAEMDTLPPASSMEQRTPKIRFEGKKLRAVGLVNATQGCF